MSKPIPQREARRLRKRVEVLESVIRQQRNRWNHDYPDGTNILTMQTVQREFLIGIRVARALGHTVVVTEGADNATLRFYAMPHAKEDV